MFFGNHHYPPVSDGHWGLVRLKIAVLWPCITIPESVTDIGSVCLSEVADALESITIPESVTSIDGTVPSQDAFLWQASLSLSL